MSGRMIPIVLLYEIPRCERCGTPLATPGLCASCAENVQEVECVTRVTIPLSEVWELEELKDFR